MPLGDCVLTRVYRKVGADQSMSACRTEQGDGWNPPDQGTQTSAGTGWERKGAMASVKP
jgi:hypothetical protein